MIHGYLIIEDDLLECGREIVERTETEEEAKILVTELNREADSEFRKYSYQKIEIEFID